MQPLGTPCWMDIETDVDVASAFYARVLGWRIEPMAAAPGWMMAYDGSETVASIGPGTPRDWRVYLGTDDIAGFVDRCRDAGGDVIVEPGQVGDLCQVAIVRDPGGAAFGVWQSGTHTGFTTTGRPGTPVWFEVNTHHGEAVRDFYAAATGLAAEPMPGPMTYFTLQAEGRPRFGIMQMQPARAEEASAWVVYLQCADVDASAAEVTDAGGRVLSGPFDSPFGRIAVCTDPLGSRFMLIRGS